MKEFDFIKMLSGFESAPSPYGIGDDGAVFGDNIIAKDIMVERVHFLPTSPLDLVIKKLFTSNVSDIAAMGGSVKGGSILLGLALNKSIDKTALVSSIYKMLEKYGLSLIGGDTVESKQDNMFSLTIIGKKGENTLIRSGAKPGDIVFLSRCTGYAQYSLHHELKLLNCGGDCFSHFNLEPELELAKLLSETEGVTSAIDISDGLGQDLCHIADQSNVRIIVEQELLPLPEIPMYKANPMVYALNSGEEYALAFTVDKNRADEIQEKIKETMNRNVYRIGEVIQGEGCFIKNKNRMTDISECGYEHD